MVSIVCEAFKCLPTQALAELQHAPLGLIDDVLELREYATAKRAYDRAEKKADLPDSDMLDLVRVVTYELMQQERNAPTDNRES